MNLFQYSIYLNYRAIYVHDTLTRIITTHSDNVDNTVIQVVNAQNILDQINQMFGNLSSGLMGNKNMSQSTINSSTTPSQNSNLVNQSITMANTLSSIPIT